MDLDQGVSEHPWDSDHGISEHPGDSDPSVNPVYSDQELKDLADSDQEVSKHPWDSEQGVNTQGLCKNRECLNTWGF